MAELDHQLGDAYRLALDNGGALDVSLAAIQRSERGWLGERDDCGSDIGCINARYEERIAYLKQLLPDSASQQAASPAEPADTTLFPHPGISGGGVVRDGPGISYTRIGSLKEGDAVSLLENAGQPMNGYPWFEIKIPDGTVGYQWGGLLCGKDVAVNGALGSCHALSCPCKGN